MPKGKSAIISWLCKECNSSNYTSRFNKKEPPMNEKQKFCKCCRKKVAHKRKETKS